MCYNICKILGGRSCMYNKTFLYCRVSTKDQNEDRQVRALNDYCNSNGIEVEGRDIFIDKVSGKNFDRPKYQALKQCLREGDTVIIKELDRLGRNKEGIKQELDYFKKNKIRIKILNIPTTLIDLPEGQEWVFDMINNILIEVLGAIAEEERNKIRQRQREGIDALKERNNGKGKGRPTIEYPNNFKQVYTEWKDKKITGVKAMEQLSLKKNTFYNLIKKYEEEAI